jgi:TonB-linked SusC/RagA family outer membrane protein
MKFMVRKFLLSVVSVVAFCSLGFAQNRPVSGVVTNEEGSPVIGVIVTVQGTTTSSVTDAAGRYTVTAPASGSLEFASFGLQTQVVAIENRSVVNVTMAPDATLIEGVVISVPYGTASKSTYTGSVSAVSGVSSLKNLPSMSFETALQGAAPGIQIGNTSGQPGAQLDIRIRGIGSYNASNAPLFVVDGVPVISGNIKEFGYGGSMSVTSTINPSDIASISILKDAAATSLYGSRGANGVIMVTTKKGQSGNLKIDFKASTGFSDFAVPNRPILNGDEAHALAYEGAYNQAIHNGMSEVAAAADAQAKADKYYPLRDSYSDWESAMMRKGSNASYEVSTSGGNDKTTFYASLGYREELGVFRGSEIAGYTGKGSLTHRDKGWTVNFETLMASMNQMTISEGSAYANPIFATRVYAHPNIPIYNEDGSYHTDMFEEWGMDNPVEQNSIDSYYNKTFRSRNTLSVGYEFFKGLSLKETLSYDYNGVEGIAIWPSNGRNGEANNGVSQRTQSQHSKLYSSLILNYNTKIGDDHDISALAGWDVDKTKYNYVYASGYGFATTKLWELDTAAEPGGIGANHTTEYLISYFGNLNYTYASKYYLSATYRRDGSSRLGANTKWGDFWSVSGSWRLTGEEFLSDVSWLDMLRIRASYGTSGNLPSGLYSSLSTYTLSGISYNGVSGSAPSRAANPNLGWEKNATFDVGIEGRFFDMIDLELDYYNRQTKDLLLSMPLSTTTGFSSQLMNVGGMNNRGVEITLSADLFKNTNFQWTTRFVAAYNRNEVTGLVNHEPFTFSSGATFQAKEGQPLYSYYMRDWAGVDPGTGESMWYIYETDENGEYTGVKNITKDPAPATRLAVGYHPNPDWTGGWSNTLYWKGFDLNFMLSFTLGGYSYDSWAYYGASSDGTISPGEGAISRTQLDRWQKPGDIAKNPKRMWTGGHGNYTSSRWLHSTDHIRLKTMVFGYTVPQKFTEKAGIRNLRAFVAGNNLLTWSRYSDYDPEVGANGEAAWAVPILKSITFGLELGF